MSQEVNSTLSEIVSIVARSNLCSYTYRHLELQKCKNSRIRVSIILIIKLGCVTSRVESLCQTVGAQSAHMINKP